MNPLVRLVLSLSALLFLSAAIVTSESALALRIGFLVAALIGAVLAIVHYRQERRGEAP